MPKMHIPVPGYAYARCGRNVEYYTNDYSQIVENALASIRDGDTQYWCKDCIRDLKRQYRIE